MNRLRFVCTQALILICMAAIAQTKTVESGNISVTIPDTWQVSNNDKESVIGSFLVIRDRNTENIYFLMDFEAVMPPEQLMQYSIINNKTISADAEWDDLEEFVFLSHKACQARFSNVFMGATRVGKAISFCDGSHSFGIVAMAPPGYDFTTDPVITSFSVIDKETKTQGPELSTREQLNNLINGFRSQFGSEISPGITWDDMELSSKKNELTFTYGISLFCKEDLTKEVLNDLVESMQPELLKTVDQMGKSFKVFQQCKKERYTFILNLVDRNKKLIHQFVVTAKDYQ